MGRGPSAFCVLAWWRNVLSAPIWKRPKGGSRGVDRWTDRHTQGFHHTPSEWQKIQPRDKANEPRGFWGWLCCTAFSPPAYLTQTLVRVQFSKGIISQISPFCSKMALLGKGYWHISSPTTTASCKPTLSSVWCTPWQVADDLQHLALGLILLDV